MSVMTVTRINMLKKESNEVKGSNVLVLLRVYFLLLFCVEQC
jgi:hypothetical protein